MKREQMPPPDTTGNEPTVAIDLLIDSCLILGTVFGAIAGYRRYLRQYTSVESIPHTVFKRRWLYGKATSVGDGDNLRFYHMPGGLLGGWGIFREVPMLERQQVKTRSNNKAATTSKRKSKTQGGFRLWLSGLFRTRKTREKQLSSYYLNLEVPYKNRRNLPTISVRLSGIDAPERAHFGNEKQPFSDEALNWLQHKVLGKTIWIKPLSVDQYGRCVARTVYWSWLGGWKDVSLEMIKEGLAVVYEGKTNAQFDGQEQKYRFYESVAKSRRKGMWIQRKVETPGQYKKRHR